MAQTAGQTVHLPDPLGDMWPWGRRINPSYDEVKKEADDWFTSLKCFDEKDSAEFVRCNFALLAALCYPELDKEEFRLTCDMFTLFFVFDQYTDVVDGKGAQELAHLALKPLKDLDAECAEDEHTVGKVASGFWKRFMAVATETCQERFIMGWKEYAEGVVQEAKDRHERTVPRSFYTGDLMRLRKLTCGAAPCMAIYLIGKELPRGFFGHPTLVRLAELTTEIIALENETYSYQKERATGDIHNLLEAINREQAPCSLQDTLYHAEKETKVRAAEFMLLVKTLHTEDPDVHKYVENFAMLALGITFWSFETERYFGKNHEQVKRDRMLVLTEEKKRVVCWE
ncbi:isoprenoid synthase domain-containing protein [Mycena olivaceomarginata]|nr:isoprenoid synthase domain-containing protein [Mycena olivaceomarginata]